MNFVYFIILSMLIVFNVEYRQADTWDQKCSNLMVKGTVINSSCYDSRG